MPVTSRSYLDERVGLFAMDGGRTTGLAWGTPLLCGTVKEIFNRDPLTVDQVNCNNLDVDEPFAENDGAKVIAETYQDCRAEWLLAGIPTTRHFFVFEDFVLRTTRHGTTERAGVAPVRVNGLVQGLLVREIVTWVPQSPSDAMTTVTNERLKRWDLWTRGMEHGRDATRHAALWVRRALA